MSISITLIIIILTVLISMQGFNNQEFMYKLSLSPYDIKHNKKGSKFLTYMFVHADWAHLLFNMISFYMFGELMETELKATFGLQVGNIHFLILYFIGGIFSTFWPMIRNQDNPNYLSLGASGAVSSIIFAAMLWNPTMELGLIFLPGIMIPAYIFGPLYLAFEFLAFKRQKTNIAHDAHIGGAVFGIIYILLINFEKGKVFFNQIFG
jgi:membrane associated rhomboid family serine protease